MLATVAQAVIQAAASVAHFLALVVTSPANQGPPFG